MSENDGEDWNLGPIKEQDDPRTNEEVAARVVGRDPVELEEQINTYDKPLIIEIATPGWQLKYWPDEDEYPRTPPGYEEGGVRYPAIPCTLEEQAEELIQGVKAGCAATHLHPRDPEDCFAINDLDMFTEVYDMVFEEVDGVPLQHSWEYTLDGGIDYLGPAKEILEAADGSNRYLEGAVVLWPPGNAYRKGYRKAVQEGVEFYEEHNIKPIHKIRSQYSARKLHRDLVQTGVMTEEPYVLVHDMGHPNGWPMDQSTWMPIDMIASIEQTKERFPDDSVVGVYSGGRNWLPITMNAILYGVDLVRVGIEDCYWMYPHRDEIIERNIDAINKLIQFCELIGREVATPEQTRDILGIEQT